MNPVTGISLGRIAVGIAALAKPDLVASTMGQSTASPLMTQWFGSREIALGAATLLARGPARRNLVVLGMAVDGADAATAYAGIQAGQVNKQLGVGLVAVAAGAVLSGLLGLFTRANRTSKAKAAA
jgi:hypothetical protein